MLSYWEKSAFLQYDYIIVGSGIVGLSAALSIKDRAPQSTVLVLERGLLPTGASTKNAGFACIGSLTEVLADLQTMPEAAVINLVNMRRSGLQLLRQRLGDATIRYAENGSYELIGTREEWALSQLARVNGLLAGLLGGPAFTPANEKLSSFGFNRNAIKHLVRNNFEGELHTGKMMRALTDAALKAGIEIKTGCEVKELQDYKTGVGVTVPDPVLGEDLHFCAKKVIVCTNAFTRKLLPDAPLSPGRGQVLITDPIPDLPFKGIFHMEEGYYYFREIDGRVLLGGGRQLDFKGETSTEFRFNDRIQRELVEILQHIILPGKKFTVADRWTGIMAFGETKQPLVQNFTDNIVVGVRMGGMGVAIGSKIGETIAAMAMDS
ncbi:Glycine/D-amino acid oxidase [Chitinophaga terrae (ex Kim and Jung 2007)]|uniref:Glycine/D-amino acid oxidase n=1 Tax=Chitinophaga terrae (ex Kim and Jung 2007) TaxID=408074 RepID=A0A1H4C432_9BACT|nr:FAD-dependent oxidoreductase [Chitinophaga terrae (ex Kim and Jung 2007)]GEP92210.1 FAD-dependent oxidoreductase [Chitinophaga terrae (ex Kim and Jung 2007)]SEA55151.1 Glycine/D-amino acid oxidase [Chitinophaga terrae (ex Kim and Jung 2007)]